MINYFGNGNNNKNIIFYDCIQNSIYPRRINPSILFSSKDNSQNINYNVCEICQQLSLSSDCPACNIINSTKFSETQSENCYFSIYEGGKTMQNQYVNWNPEYRAGEMKIISKTGIYNLPNISLLNNSPREIMPGENINLLKKESFAGSYMPNNITPYPFGILGNTVKMAETQDQFLQDKKILYDDEILHDDEIYSKYCNKYSLLSDILYNLPKGTKNNPIVYFVRICRGTDPERVQLVRQKSIKQESNMLRNLSDLQEGRGRRKDVGADESKGSPE